MRSQGKSYTEKLNGPLPGVRELQTRFLAFQTCNLRPDARTFACHEKSRLAQIGRAPPSLEVPRLGYALDCQKVDRSNVC
jgi:hypothetical protein